MKKSSVAIILLVFFGFIFFILGGVLLICGSLVESDGAIKIALASLFIGIGFYVVLLIYLIIYFIMRHKKEVKK